MIAKFAAWWRRIIGVRTHAFVAVLVFLATLAAFVYYAQSVRSGVSRDEKAAFQQQLRVFSTAAVTRLELYENFLRGGAGLFGLDDSLTQTKWTRYFEPYDIGQSFPAIKSIGFSRYVTNAELPEYVGMVRAQDWPAFTVRPTGTRNAYVPLTFAAMFSGSSGGKTIGFDSFTDSARHTAMQTALNSGEPAMTGAVTSASMPGKNPQFLIYLPVYRNGASLQSPAERQAAIFGFTSVAVNIKTLLDGLLATTPNPNFGLKFVDAQAPAGAKAAYQSSNFAHLAAESGHLSTSTPFMLYQHKWEITFVAGSGIISSADRQRPITLLLTGVLASIVLAGAVWFLTSSREFWLNRQKQLEVQSAKDDLLSLASHQLRTPATVVKQYVGMLLQGYGGKLTRKQTGMLENAYTSNERQLEIINQLLYVARLDAGRIKLHKEKVDLGEMVKEACSEQTVGTKQRHQKIIFKLPKRPFIVKVDPHYFRMVLDNLLSNAIKYTPDRGTITVSIRRLHGEVLVTVSDTGIGIDETRKEVIFDKFTRLENEVAGSPNGSGIGLYLVRQIVNLHDGRIDVDSKLGHGSRFTILLPDRSEERTDDAPSE